MYWNNSYCYIYKILLKLLLLLVLLLLLLLLIQTFYLFCCAILVAGQCSVGRSPFVRSDKSVLKWSARVLGLARMVLLNWSETLSSPAPVGQSAGIWRIVAGKMYARALDLPFKLARTSSFRPARTDKWKATSNVSPVFQTFYWSFYSVCMCVFMLVCRRISYLNSKHVVFGQVWRWHRVHDLHTPWLLLEVYVALHLPCSRWGHHTRKCSEHVFEPSRLHCLGPCQGNLTFDVTYFDTNNTIVVLDHLTIFH